MLEKRYICHTVLLEDTRRAVTIYYGNMTSVADREPAFKGYVMTCSGNIMDTSGFGPATATYSSYNKDKS